MSMIIDKKLNLQNGALDIIRKGVIMQFLSQLV